MTQRFWAKVDRSEADEKGCWVWAGARLPRGYGRFYWRGKPRYAHRVSLELSGIDVPDDKLVLHACDNPSCVRPSHLSVGTQLENMRDASSKGRTVRVQDWSGSKNPKAKLTEDQVDEIRNSSLKTSELCKKFGVTRARIQQIRRGVRMTPHATRLPRAGRFHQRAHTGQTHGQDDNEGRPG